MKNLIFKKLTLLASISGILAACTMYDSFDEDLLPNHANAEGDPSYSSPVTDGSSSSEGSSDPSSVSSLSSGSETGDVSSSGGNAVESSQSVDPGTSSASEPGSSEAEVNSSSSETVSSSSTADCPAYVTDSRGGTDFTYNILKFTVDGTNKCWFKENLAYNYSTSKCYGGEQKNCDKYGRLYLGNSLTAICPEGSHISTPEDWTHLAKAMGYKSADFSTGTFVYDMGWDLKAEAEWSSCTNCTMKFKDSYGFSALPGGYYIAYMEKYDEMEETGRWWVVDGEDLGYAEVYYDNDDVKYMTGLDEPEELGISIRCVLD